MSYTDHSVKQEIVMLSRYKGLRSSRCLTVLLSLCSINTLYPAGILFTLTGLMLPLMITFAAPEQKKKEPLTQLSSLMRQYRFNTIRFTAERWSSSFLLLFLIAWQWQLNQSQTRLLWHYFAGALFIVYVLLRIAFTIAYRIYFHYQYTHMNFL